MPDEEHAALMKDSSIAAHLAFADNHNAGYYINSYTTKLNPTMDNVLKRLLESVRRLQHEWQESDTAKGNTTDGVDGEKDARQQNFNRTMQVSQGSNPASAEHHGKVVAKWPFRYYSATSHLRHIVVGQYICAEPFSLLR